VSLPRQLQAGSEVGVPAILLVAILSVPAVSIGAARAAYIPLPVSGGGNRAVGPWISGKGTVAHHRCSHRLARMIWAVRHGSA
jgi:hypothetical protein